MSTRVLLAAPALALVLAASPAAAKPGSTEKMTEMMRDPATQQAMARAVAAMSEAMLDMPLEPLARAAEAMGDRRTAREMRRSTLGDYAGPEARDVPRKMSRQLPAIMGAMGGMAAAAEEMTPALKAMAKEMGARMKDAMRDGASGESRDYRDEDYRTSPRDDENSDAPPPSASEEPDQGPYATPAPDEGDAGL
ncbi:MAG: hypothetical protein Q8R44_06760 [Novosphingobium sp.]|nr:hypothetical protein [Novosphingobium sp.]